MKVQLEYGRTAKVLHWTVVALLVTSQTRCCTWSIAETAFMQRMLPQL
jgi:hypothetical protein